ncbi:hypothetical protein ACQ7B2_01035, partial [Escherichia coli]
VMLFIIDSAGLRQATCEMALGGRGEPEQAVLRWNLGARLRELRDYVDDALQSPRPRDSLYEAWVDQAGEH